ncbi:hypothetical protein [Paenibacillus gallinarum]|uniref:Uncharacterized protein n=1 Tax=Paenibacillus gallinarum TaxID=2762232 RepID=A0ABR8T3H7_9BACL|nr:hypothetical protein [Paenibacillus gallinarum]MBD7970315.1 hypothetical protein [Paenibacillus gallinarum]
MKNNKAVSQTERRFNLVPSQAELQDGGLPAGESSMSKASLFMTRVFGIFTLGLSVSLFVQLVPFVFLFVAGYIGIPADKSLNNMNSMVWILTCVTIMLVIVYGFIAWMKFVWRRLISQPKSIFLFIKRRKKEAE